MPKGNVALAAYKAGERAKKSSKHRRRQTRIPLAVLAGFSVPAMEAYKAFGETGISGATGILLAGFTGYNKWEHKFILGNLKLGLVPVGLGLIVHKLATKFGLNRIIRNSGIPYIEI